MFKFFNNKPLDAEYLALTPKIAHFFEHHILPSWWVVFFLLLCYMAYERSLYKINHEYSKLHHQYMELIMQKKEALALQEDFLLQINSQSDQDWIELTLMKGLGLVPEEEIKVFFNQE